MTKLRRNSVSTNSGLLFAVAAAVLIASAPAQAEKISLKIASGHSPGWHFVEMTKDFFIPEVTKRVKEKTGHEIEFVEGWSGAMVKPTEVLEAVETGIIDIGMFCICHEGQKLALHNFSFYLPFGPSDPAISLKASRKMYDTVPELNQVFTKYGQTLLGLVPFEPYDLVAKNPIAKAADVKGRKVGAAGPNAFWVSDVGALPVSVGGPDMYTSFQTGLIDSMLIFPSVMETLKLNEVAPYLVKTSFGSMAVSSLTVNNRRMSRLPKEVAAIIVEVGREMEGRAGAFTTGLVEKKTKILQDKGVKVVEVGADDRKAWAELLADAPAKIGKKFEVESKLPVRKVMEAYMAETESLGHKWPVRYKLD